MSKKLACWLSILIISELMKHTSKDFSSYEYELLEYKLIKGQFSEVEEYIKKYL